MSDNQSDLCARIRRYLEVDDLDHDTTYRLLREAADALEASRWQPIDTAPTNGEIMALVYEPSPYPDERIFLGLLNQVGCWEIAYDGQLLSPTHWIPLPAEPYKI